MNVWMPIYKVTKSDHVTIFVVFKNLFCAFVAVNPAHQESSLRCYLTDGEGDAGELPGVALSPIKFRFEHGRLRI
jgi:hypothetical protein